MSWIAILVASSLQSADVEVRYTQPADWACAQPLIERNAVNPLPARQLGKSIALVCAVPYRPRTLHTRQDMSRERVEQAYYRHALGVFEGDVILKLISAQQAMQMIIP